MAYNKALWQDNGRSVTHSPGEGFMQSLTTPEACIMMLAVLSAWTWICITAKFKRESTRTMYCGGSSSIYCNVCHVCHVCLFVCLICIDLFPFFQYGKMTLSLAIRGCCHRYMQHIIIIEAQRYLVVPLRKVGKDMEENRKIRLTSIARWWFQRFFIFIPIWGRFPSWLIFFRWVETTNQIVLGRNALMWLCMDGSTTIALETPLTRF